MASSSSKGCYYVVQVTIPVIKMEGTMVTTPYKQVPSEPNVVFLNFPLIVGTVLKKNMEDGKYYTIQDLVLVNTIIPGAHVHIKLKRITIPDDKLDILRPIDDDTSAPELYDIVPGMINKIYSNFDGINIGKNNEKDILEILDIEEVKAHTARINAIIRSWKEPAEPSSCAIAGGRRRPKKSRRTRSTRKRRQTRSK